MMTVLFTRPVGKAIGLLVEVTGSDKYYMKFLCPPSTDLRFMTSLAQKCRQRGMGGSRKWKVATPPQGGTHHQLRSPDVE